jgi:NAD(P)H-dependent FMN reductase
MTRIGVILGSARSGRRGGQVAHWVLGLADERDDAELTSLRRLANAEEKIVTEGAKK